MGRTEQVNRLASEISSDVYRMLGDAGIDLGMAIAAMQIVSNNLKCAAEATVILANSNFADITYKMRK